MEASNNNNNNNNNNDKNKSNVYDIIDDFRGNLSKFFGVIIALIGIILVFLVSSLEGTKEIKASNRDNAIMLNMWREEHELEGGFPENRVGTISYKNEEYYFIVSEFGENGEVLSWYFAFDGGFGYIFKDWKFYVLTLITIMVSIYVSKVNYTTSKNQAMSGIRFMKTLKVYQDAKDKVKEHTQYIPMFCSYKNKQLYEETKQEIVESLDINYDYFKSESFDVEKLEDWQKQGLEAIKKIKIERISSSDLLREKNDISTKKSHLPISPEEHERRYLRSASIQKVFSSILSGMTISLGFILGNWALGASYAFVVFLSFITSNITGGDYANGGLRQRYIGKADLLNEFYNMIDYFIELDKQEKMKYNKVVKEEIIDNKEGDVSNETNTFPTLVIEG